MHWSKLDFVGDPNPAPQQEKFSKSKGLLSNQVDWCNWVKFVGLFCRHIIRRVTVAKSRMAAFLLSLATGFLIKVRSM
jgi:hypothetical protein